MKLLLLLILLSCSGNVVEIGTLSWQNNPRVSVDFYTLKNSIYTKTEDEGFANTLSLRVKDIPIGYQISISRDNTCSIQEGSTKTVNSSYTNFDNISILTNSSTFFVKVETGTDIYCLPGNNYYQVSITNFTITSGEGQISVSWQLDRDIETTAKVSINGIEKQITNGQTIYDLYNIPQLIKLILTDTGNSSITANDTITPNSIEKATGKLLKHISKDAFIIPAGVATNAIIRGEGFLPTDIVGLYIDPNCTINIVPDLPILPSSSDFTVDLNTGVNNFYIKRIPLGNTNRFSCSDAITYTKANINIALQPTDNGTIDGSINPDVSIDPSYSLSINGGLYSTISSPFSISGLTPTEHTMTFMILDINDDVDTQSIEVTAIDALPVETLLVKNNNSIFHSYRGFIATGKIIVSKFANGDLISIYKNSNCSTDELIPNTSVSGTSYEFPISFELGNNHFYVKRTIPSGKSSCIEAPSFSRYDFRMAITANEESLTTTVAASIPASFKINLDGSTNLPITDSHTFPNLNTSAHSISVTATDNNGDVITKTATDLYATPLNKVTLAIYKDTSDTNFNSNPGFSDYAYIKVTNFNTGDALSVYRDDICSGTPVIGETISSNNPFYFEVPLNNGDNIFYVRRTTVNSSSCSDAVIYHKGIINLTLNSMELGFSANWDISMPILGATYALQLDSGPIINPSTNSYIFSDLSESLHSLVVRATDLDGNSTTASGIVLATPLQKVHLSLLKEGLLTEFLSNPGYSTNGVIRVSGFKSRDKLELYNTEYCINTPLQTIESAIDIPQYFSTTFTAGINKFYIKRYDFEDNTKTTCSNPIIYQQEVMSSIQPLLLEAHSSSIAGQWETPNNLVPGSKYIFTLEDSNHYMAQSNPIGTTATNRIIIDMNMLLASVEILNKKDNYTINIYAFDLDESLVRVASGSKLWPPKYINLFPTGRLEHASLPSFIDPFQGKVGQIGFGLFVAGIQEGGGTALYSAYADYLQSGISRIFPYSYSSISGTIGAFAGLLLKTNENTGSIRSYGYQEYGGDPSTVPFGDDFKSITGNQLAFAAIRENKTIAVWGDPASGGDQTTAPTQNDFEAVAANAKAFAGLRTDGSIITWGDPTNSGSHRPSISGFVSVMGISNGFAGLHSDGSVHLWFEGTNDSIISGMESNCMAFTTSYSGISCLKTNGQVISWYVDDTPNYGNPPGVFTAIIGGLKSFAGLRPDGSIYSWGDPEEITGSPIGVGYTFITANADGAYAALTYDKKVKAWGKTEAGGTTAPTDSGYTKIVSMRYEFAALKEDGTIVNWGGNGISGPP